MTTVTTTHTYQIPVPTELAKTVLGMTFGSALDAQLDPVTMGTNPGEIGNGDSFIAGGTDEVIREYMTDTNRLHRIENLFLSLLEVKPGKDATLTIPEWCGLLEMLDSTIDTLAENQVGGEVRMTQRQVAEEIAAAMAEGVEQTRVATLLGKERIAELPESERDLVVGALRAARGIGDGQAQRERCRASIQKLSPAAASLLLECMKDEKLRRQVHVVFEGGDA
jgi:hypothetical protein